MGKARSGARRGRRLAVAALLAIAASPFIPDLRRDDDRPPARFWVRDGDATLYDAPDGDPLPTGWTASVVDREDSDEFEYLQDPEPSRFQRWLEEARAWWSGVAPAPTAGGPVYGGLSTGGLSVTFVTLGVQSCVVTTEQRDSGTWKVCVQRPAGVRGARRCPPDLVGAWAYHPNWLHGEPGTLYLGADGSLAWRTGPGRLELTAQGRPTRSAGGVLSHGRWSAEGNLLLLEVRDCETQAIFRSSYRLKPLRDAFGFPVTERARRDGDGRTRIVHRFPSIVGWRFDSAYAPDR